MKKLILCAVLIVMTTHAYAWKVTVSGKAEIGTDIESYNSFLDVNLGLNIYFWKCQFKVYVDSRTWFVMNTDDGLTGYPFREIYGYGLTFFIFQKDMKSNTGFFVNYHHICNHPVKSNPLHSDYYTIDGIKYYRANDKWLNNMWGETMSTVSIGYKFELPVYTSK